ncbi:hypothetical protein ECTW07945_2937, partial [Escherichia coli TW07945]
MNAAQGLTGS